jgi:hypothetical protein
MPEAQHQSAPGESVQLVSLGLLSAGLWAASIFTDLGFYPLFHAPVYSPGTGWTLLIWGWLGPTGLSVAWYGNIPLLVCIAMLLCSRRPSFGLATVSLVIAASGLLPMYTYDMIPGSTWSLVRGPAVWLWLASFVIAWLPAAHSRWVTGAGQSHKKL